MLTHLLFTSMPDAAVAAAGAETAARPPSPPLSEGHGLAIAAGIALLWAFFGWLLWRRHDRGGHS